MDVRDLHYAVNLDGREAHYYWAGFHGYEARSPLPFQLWMWTGAFFVRFRFRLTCFELFVQLHVSGGRTWPWHYGCEACWLQWHYEREAYCLQYSLHGYEALHDHQLDGREAYCFEYYHHVREVHWSYY